MIRKKKTKKRKKRKKIIIDNTAAEPESWKDKKPFKYIFSTLNFSGFAIDGIASLLTIGVIIGIFLLIPAIWWGTFKDGFTTWNIFNNILLTLFLWVIIGFCIEEFEGLKSLVYLIAILLVGLIAYGFYENIKFNRCVEKFIERPYTYDKKKFVDCDMISETKAYGRSEESVRYEMMQKFSNR